MRYIKTFRVHVLAPMLCIDANFCLKVTERMLLKSNIYY